jgi:hypothetical protein
MAPASSRSMIRRGVLLLPALPIAITVLAACGGSTDTQSVSTTPVTEQTKLSATVDKPDELTKEAPADQEVSEFTGFRSPSGNVGCYLDVDYVRCDIADANWSPPPRPADCEFDYGQGITLAPGGSAEFVCAGDTALVPDGTPLPYGESIAAGPLRCDSAESGSRAGIPRPARASRFPARRIGSSELA